MRWFEQLREAWDTYVTELIGDIIEAADRAVRQVWRGAGRGSEANIESTGVFMVRKGRVISVEQFWDHAEALETLGLSEKSSEFR